MLSDEAKELPCDIALHASSDSFLTMADLDRKMDISMELSDVNGSSFSNIPSCNHDSTGESLELLIEDPATMSSTPPILEESTKPEVNNNTTSINMTDSVDSNITVSEELAPVVVSKPVTPKATEPPRVYNTAKPPAFTKKTVKTFSAVSTLRRYLNLYSYNNVNTNNSVNACTSEVNIEPKASTDQSNDDKDILTSVINSLTLNSQEVTVEAVFSHILFQSACQRIENPSIRKIMSSLKHFVTLEALLAPAYTLFQSSSSIVSLSDKKSTPVTKTLSNSSVDSTRGDDEEIDISNNTSVPASASTNTVARERLPPVQLSSLDCLTVDTSKPFVNYLFPAQYTIFNERDKPTEYTKITKNRYSKSCPALRINHKFVEVEVCGCSEGDCSVDTDCSLFHSNTECSEQHCLRGDLCRNQRMTKKEYAKSTLTRTGDKGWGLTLDEDVKKGTLIIEYVGELIDNQEANTRMKASLDKGELNLYLFTVSPGRIIDAGPMGNLARFINHSCNPNCHTEKWTVNFEVRAGIFASTDLKQGTELTYNYNFTDVKEKATKCLCGSENCSGYMGEKPKSKSFKKKQ